jgi:hypothetical protein
MKTLIFALGLMATIAYAQFDLSTLEPSPQSCGPNGCFDLATLRPAAPRQPIPDHEASGFGGYGFGSSRDFVRFERGIDGYVKDEEYAEWIWYTGKLDGCGLRSGYQFSRRDKLIGGIWSINNSDECFKRIESVLDEHYGDRSIEIRGSTIVSERWIPHTRIIHRKNPEYHAVTFRDTFETTHYNGGP